MIFDHIDSSALLWSADKHGDGNGLERGLLDGLLVKSNDMCNGNPTLFGNDVFFLGLELCEDFLGLLFIKCLSTHLSIVKTESVDGRRRSAAVLMIFELAIRKVAATPRRA